MKILVIGSLNMDHRYQLHHLPAIGETILSDDFSKSRGGKGQNQAVCAARLGSPVKIFGGIGKDEDGLLILEGLKADGVDTDFLLEKEEPSGHASIYVDSQGNNTIIVYPGANGSLKVWDMDQFPHLFDNVSYCVLQLEIPLDTVYRALEICNEKNIPVLLNPAPANPHFNPHYLQYVDYFLPNETELALILNRSLPDKEEELVQCAKELVDQGCTNVIVTLGSQGSLWVHGKGFLKVPAKKVDAIDTTAAGDSYIGALAHGLHQGLSLEQAMELATEVAAITVTRKGAIDSLPYGHFKEELS